MVALLEFFLMIRSPFLMAWDEVPFGLLGPIGDPGALDPRLAYERATVSLERGLRLVCPERKVFSTLSS